MVILGKLILEREGYDFLSAGDGQGGLQTLQENVDRVNLILLDIMLPEMYGWEVLEKIRSEEATKDIPVIMLTAKHYLEDEGEASHYEDMFNAYVVKPFVVRELLDKIAGVLNQ
jgi:CheY-like chemotaxis protein